jgi:nucleotide-binding universal stress UspA family protein
MDEPGYRHVLVPLDGSELADGALPTGRALAERFGSDLHVISVAESAGDVEKLRAHATDLLGSGAVGDDHVEVVVGNDPASAIQRRAAQLSECLVCLSTQGRGRFVGAVIGSVARSLLQTIGEPIVAVGPYADRPTSRVPHPPAPLSAPRLLACVDGSAHSETMLPVAAAWARRLEMALTLLTVAEPTLPPVRPGASWLRHHGPNEDAEVYLERLRQEWHDAASEVDTHVVYDPIGPGQGLHAYLVDDPRPVGLVAVTTHAREGLQRAMLGAGAADMVYRSTVPVLVVPLSLAPEPTDAPNRP